MPRLVYSAEEGARAFSMDQTIAPLPVRSRSAQSRVRDHGVSLTPSRLLKNSFAFGDEAGVIAVVDEDVPDEPPGGA